MAIDLEKLRKIWNLSEHGQGGEKDAARARAQALVSAHGYTLNDIPSLLNLRADKEADSFDSKRGFYSDFWRQAADAEQHEKEAERQKKEDEKRRAQEARKKQRDAETAWRRAHKPEVDAIIKRCGGYEAVFRNTPEEQKIVDAVAPFEMRGIKWPTDATEAIKAALPLPQTIDDAIAEYRKWVAICREREMVGRYRERKRISWNVQEAAVNERRWIVTDLAACNLPARDIGELMRRVQFQIEQEVSDPKHQEAILRDLARIDAQVESERRQRASTSAPVTRRTRNQKPKTATQRRREVEAILATEEGRTMSLRQIAGRVGVSPATVMKVRRDMSEGSE
ncbi:hypothetical protein [Brytella acorum]|uniref:Uncharacterized protein n=1 Tax=Brytella acorum TaxID=2959299 RepID=A0AA35V801_9PROT|nr:hypothetical protein [Brytella acorum]CAI9119548.1 hypothetical protein LMG32879_000365 [Brytella acorum]